MLFNVIKTVKLYAQCKRKLPPDPQQGSNLIETMVETDGLDFSVPKLTREG